MVKLIRADLARMFKTKSFWICGGLLVALTLLNFIFDYCAVPEVAKQLGTFITNGGSNMMLFVAIFASLFFGTDYSNGTIRNKMAVGHGRCSIYFSNLITGSVGGALYCAANWAGLLLTGLFVGGKLGIDAGELALKALILLLAMIGMCSLFTLVGMLISSKSSAVVVSIIGTLVLMIGAAMLLQILYAPEYTDGGFIITAEGVQPGEPELNPYYVRGATRDFLQTVCDVLPSGQAMQLEMGELHNAGLMPVYSVVFTAAVSAIGAAAFRRKDLK